MDVGTARTWDVENRLTSITKDGITTTFVYDGDGNRVKKTVGNVTTLYVNQYYEKNLDSGEITTYYYLGGKMVAQRKDTTLTYIHQDSLGSSSAASNANGSSEGSIRYLPFGLTRSGMDTLSDNTDKLFTGQRLDFTTDLYYYGARYYDPEIGRFISAETIVPDPANPQTLNRYSYCLNNPLKYIDPTGHDVFIKGVNVAILYSYINGLMNGYPTQMSQEYLDILTSDEFRAYDAFRNSSPQAQHMAWSMEVSEDHDVFIESGKISSWYAKTNENGDNFTVTINTEAYELDLWEQGQVINQEVYLNILETNPNYNYLSAAIEGGLGLLPNCISIPSDAIDMYYQTTKNGENPLVQAVDKGCGYIPVIGNGYGLLSGFFGNLIRQQDYYDFYLRYQRIPYPFKGN
jgi:RHS repeat-associated protein